MNNSDTESSQKRTVKEDQLDTTQELQSVDSSADSGASSDSPGSESGSTETQTGSETSVVDESGSSSGSTSNGEQSDEEEDPASDLNATFKSAVGSVPLSDSTSQVPAPETPSAPAPVNSKSASPSAVAASSGSPAIVTPAKSLVFDDNSTSGVVKEEVSVSSPKLGIMGQLSVIQSAPPADAESLKIAMPPPATDQPSASKIASADAKSHKDKSNKRKSAKTPADEVAKQPTNQKEVRKANKKDSKKEKVPKVSKVTAGHPKEAPSTPPQVKPKKEAESSVRKRVKKAANSKQPAKKVKVAEPRSSTNESQSSESSPDAPVVSSRISRISKGRQYQNLAMSKAKVLGNVVDGSVEVLGVSEALKVVKAAQAHFDVQPEHSFRDYHRVHGTQLPHVQKIYGDIQTRYEAILTATSDLELTLARQHDLDKKSLIKPDAGSKYVKIWQFDNDLVRADPSDQVDLSGGSGAASTSKVVLAVDFKDLPSLQGTPARKQVVKEFNEASLFADHAKNEAKGSSSRGKDKEPKKKRKKHKSEVIS